MCIFSLSGKPDKAKNIVICFDFPKTIFFALNILQDITIITFIYYIRHLFLAKSFDKREKYINNCLLFKLLISFFQLEAIALKFLIKK